MTVSFTHQEMYIHITGYHGFIGTYVHNYVLCTINTITSPLISDWTALKP